MSSSAGLSEVVKAKRGGALRPLASLLRSVTAFHDLVEAWPAEVYEEPVVESRLLGRPITFVVDPELIRVLLTEEAHRLARDEAMTRSLAPLLGTGLLLAEGSAWRAQRRTAAPTFRPERIQAFLPAMVTAADATRRRWLAAGRARVDLQAEMMRTALDVIAAVAISGDEGFDHAAFAQRLHAYLGQTNWSIAYGVMGAPVWLPHPGAGAGRRAAQELRTTTAAVIARRRLRGESGADLLGAMLEATDPETGEPFSDERLVDNLLTFVVAGHETTALAMAWALRLIAAYPETERRILEEVAALPGRLDAPGASDRLIFTRQVVLEALRLFPPAALLVRRVTNELCLGDVRVPVGRSIHVPVYALHRHRRLWREPDCFDPDRFAPELQSARHRFAFLPFGGGQRVCVGMGLAMTECLIVLATLLPALRLHPLGPALPRTRLRVTLRPVGGLPVTIQPREGT